MEMEMLIVWYNNEIIWQWKRIADYMLWEHSFRNVTKPAILVHPQPWKPNQNQQRWPVPHYNQLLSFNFQNSYAISKNETHPLIKLWHSFYPSDVSPPARVASNAQSVAVVGSHKHQSFTDIHSIQHRLYLRTRLIYHTIYYSFLLELLSP